MFDTNKNINRYGDMLFDLSDPETREGLISAAKAISHPLRIEMLNQIIRMPRSITDLSKLNHVSNSTVIFHLNILEESGLVFSKVKPNKKGKTLMFYINFSHMSFVLENNKSNDSVTVSEQSMGVGNYISASVDEYIRIATQSRFTVFEKDDMYNPERFDAGLICIDNGEISYAFSNAFAKKNKVDKIEFSMELSSESPYYCNDWKSEIFFSVCGVEVASYLSLGDFGGERGKLNPSWWDSKYSQYGVLTTVGVDEEGVTLNGRRVRSDLTLSDIDLSEGDYITLSLRTDPKSQYASGFNIYGRYFGNEKQDILMKFISYDRCKNKLASTEKENE